MEIAAQENAPAPVRTPEQEAVLQTQKMQKELQLNPEQEQAIYEINLKHARERQVSNSRTQALERTRNKNSAIKQVLSNEQYDQLQYKRYERYPTGSNRYVNKASHEQHQSQSTQEQLRTATSVPQVNREVIRPANRTTPNDATIRNNPSSVPTRERIIVRPPSNNSNSNQVPQRR